MPCIIYKIPLRTSHGLNWEIKEGFLFASFVKKEAIRSDSDEKAILYGKEVYNTTYCTCLSEYLMPSSSCLQCGKDEAGRMEPQGKGVPITRKK